MKRPSYSTGSTSRTQPSGAAGVGTLLQKDRSAVNVTTVKPVKPAKTPDASRSAPTSIGSARQGETLTPEQIRDSWRRRWALPETVTGVGGRTIFRMASDPTLMISRPWGPYLAVKGVPVFAEDSALISLVDARAASGEPSTVSSVLLPVSGAVAFSAAGDPVSQLDRAIVLDGRIRSMLSVLPREPGGELVVAIEHPAVDARSTVQKIGQIFAGQEFWMSGRGEERCPRGSARCGTTSRIATIRGRSSFFSARG